MFEYLKHIAGELKKRSGTGRSIKVIGFLIEKEFKQLKRNSFMPRLILIMPCMVMLVFPWAANMEVKNVNLYVVDNDHSPLSERMIRKIEASEYFYLNGVTASWEEAMKGVERGKADAILDIPVHFERDLIKDGKARVLVSANTVNGTRGLLGSSYLSAVITDYVSEISEEKGLYIGQQIIPVIQVIPQYRFNPNLDYKVFMVPALMVMLMTMLCGFLPALNIVSEKESGTIEQINVTPVGKFAFIVAKLLPYWMIGFLILTFCFGLAWAVYGLIPLGSLSTIYLAEALFVLTISGLGLVISNYSGTMQQAMFVMYFFVIILMLMSGIFTPVRSMPEWAQWITVFNPLKYFMEVLRFVYLKGSGIWELLPQLGMLAGFALFLNLLAVWSYRKTA